VTSWSSPSRQVLGRRHEASFAWVRVRLAELEDTDELHDILAGF
jgi:hypothetical protein